MIHSWLYTPKDLTAGIRSFLVCFRSYFGTNKALSFVSCYRLARRQLWEWECSCYPHSCVKTLNEKFDGKDFGVVSRNLPMYSNYPHILICSFASRGLLAKWWKKLKALFVSHFFAFSHSLRALNSLWLTEPANTIYTIQSQFRYWNQSRPPCAMSSEAAWNYFRTHVS